MKLNFFFINSIENNPPPPSVLPPGTPIDENLYILITLICIGVFFICKSKISREDN